MTPRTDTALLVIDAQQSFRFIVVNDTHHMSPECGVYLGGAIRLMQQHSPAFCLT